MAKTPEPPSSPRSGPAPGHAPDPDRPPNPDHAPDPNQPPDPDLLAAVVLDTLVAAAPRALTLTEVARACERVPEHLPEAREVEIALRILVADELATRTDDRYRATRAAIRAAELSF